MKNRILLSSVIILIGAIVVACGGGGGGGGSSTGGSSSTSLSGTASVGAPMSGATITLTDVTGATQQTIADENGAYSFSDIANLKAPILVSASGYVGNNPATYSGIVTSVNSGAVTVANASPLTDAIVFQASGQSAGTLLTNPSAMSTITSSAVASSASQVATAISNVLNGITSGSANGYNSISTGYVADGIGAYDKVHDLVSVYMTPISGSSAMAINIADKSGTVGTTTITPGQTVTPLPTIPSAISNLALSSLQKGYVKFNSVISTASGLNGSQFGAFFSDNYLDNGQTKELLMSQLRNSSGGSYLLGATLSNPVVNSCTINGACNVSFLLTRADKSLNKINQTYIYDSSSGNWLLYGNQQGNVQVGFQSYAQLSNATNTFNVGINFGIMGNNETAANNPYNSATATFQTASGTVDATINFIQKTSVGGSCSPSSSNYYGLPITDVTNPSTRTPDLASSNACNNWITISDESTLKTVNSHIAAGGYKLVVKAYTSNNWTGTPVTVTQTLTSPLITSDVINVSMFPKVAPATGASGPYLSISNASDYTLVGSVCMSSNAQIGYCDMTNKPSNTSVYNSNSNVALLGKYSPLTAWPSGQTIRTYFVHAQDKYGRDLRVNN
ncbi:carboxypeptidase-like regulatory domain-containing protein [Polynucleobacter sp. JS-Fieb-80-E5]|uniref:carboxypeptidase-like regulatory domain-containing protein n=1 Tax=Polynucleobacter sp. JS-Fieb-80-E5 TaxID=2081050 RepID=UPI001C0B16AC|nr:carboxypeptidase-like regulatory domain-containing protein [Polynucleobacter sp. JS-Fieb-80-E5]MBU3618577.1 carboxypeptidase regulatory-like domain-containing protein [Polynucleobacter sp. JS-Fieb-80-E5]